jgi:hypothetical protein
VPSYYSSSSQQRSRRPLEMKKRSSRLLERGREVRYSFNTDLSFSDYPFNDYP